MRTEANNNHPLFPEGEGGPLNLELVDELKGLIALIHNDADGGLRSNGHAGKGLALVRILKQMRIEEWETFAVAHGLEDWLAVPLAKTQAESLSMLLSLQERLIFQRDHDALTGIGNRGLFDRCFAAEVTRALRSRTELSLIMLDLDNFKSINDTYGHACGDKVLQRLGHILQTSVRRYDIPARVGGEEFAIILPSTSCWTAVMLGNRILNLFRQEILECDEKAFSMTFSAGVSSLALLDGEQDVVSLMKSADSAMYAAKGQGKNRVILAEGGKLAKDRGSLVQAQEKQFLFSCLGLE